MTKSLAPEKTPSNKPFDLFDTYWMLPPVPSKLIPRLHKLCGPRYIDLLLHMPSGIVRRTFRHTLDTCVENEVSVLELTIGKHHKSANPRGPYRIIGHDSTGEPLEMIFFTGAQWLKKTYPEGRKLRISGEIQRQLTNIQMVHPENHGPSKSLDDICGISAVYPLTAGITLKTITNAIQFVLKKMLTQTAHADWLPVAVLKQQNWPSFARALAEIHMPTKDDISNPQHPARERLAFDELYSWQLALINAREENLHMDGILHEPTGKLRSQFLEALPFELTGDQKRTIMEIDADMSIDTPMVRLTQGDVGSGKTVVAFAALLSAIECGHQGVMMAPTEILALQHLDNAKKWLEPLGVRIGILTGKLKAKAKRETKAAIAAGEYDLIIGTHALIEADVIIPELSLVVIDEQHRFGVKQRLALTKGKAPDLLVMTATPIPRTLALTFYGDMDISIIAEKPPGRKDIDTRAFSLEKLSTVAKSLENIISTGQQVYWVCPLVDESEKSDLAAASMRHETLKQLYANDVALLHGKMKGVEKEQILNNFKNGECKILVSTTVIEVGVDVPQATVIVIEHAERFGLAQLHQLRGRVGRGKIASTCLLLHGNLGQFGKERIDVMRSTNDGFIIAEKDMQLRGPGEALGTAQAGALFTKTADLSEHKDLIPLARNLAREQEDIAKLLQQSTSHQQLLRVFGREHAQDLINAG